MKIYFAGSIRGGRDDAALYYEIIVLLQQYGAVLTEHVGLASLTDIGEARLPQEIFERDCGWLKEADVVVAEVTQPSLGVGYELGLAETLRIPILCLFRPSSGRSLSAMIGGNPYVTLQEYENAQGVAAVLSTYFIDKK